MKLTFSIQNALLQAERANNGSALAGLNTNTPWYNLSIGIVILLGRFLPLVALLAMADSHRFCAVYI